MKKRSSRVWIVSGWSRVVKPRRRVPRLKIVTP